MSPKIFNDTIGNRSRDLPVCSAVPQPLRHHVPHTILNGVNCYKRISNMALENMLKINMVKQNNELLFFSKGERRKTTLKIFLKIEHHSWIGNIIVQTSL
jgi:hypothetical protein